MRIKRINQLHQWTPRTIKRQVQRNTLREKRNVCEKARKIEKITCC